MTAQSTKIEDPTSIAAPTVSSGAVREDTGKGGGFIITGLLKGVAQDQSNCELRYFSSGFPSFFKGSICRRSPNIDSWSGLILPTTFTKTACLFPDRKSTRLNSSHGY